MDEAFFYTHRPKCPWFKYNHLCAGNTVWNTHLGRTEMRSCDIDTCPIAFWSKVGAV